MVRFAGVALILLFAVLPALATGLPGESISAAAEENATKGLVLASQGPISGEAPAAVIWLVAPVYSEANASYQETKARLEPYFKWPLPDNPTEPKGDEISGLEMNPTVFEAIDEAIPDIPVAEIPVAAALWDDEDGMTAELQAPAASANARIGPQGTQSPTVQQPEVESELPPVLTSSTIHEVDRPASIPFTKIAVVIVAAVALMQLASGSAAASKGLAFMRRLRPGLAAPLFTRIKSHQALQDMRRLTLYRLIAANPGISIKELCDAAQMSRSAVEHHLTVVARAKLVVTETFGHGRHFFAAAKFQDRSHRLAHARRPLRKGPPQS